MDRCHASFRGQSEQDSLLAAGAVQACHSTDSGAATSRSKVSVAKRPIENSLQIANGHLAIDTAEIGAIVVSAPAAIGAEKTRTSSNRCTNTCVAPTVSGNAANCSAPDSAPRGLPASPSVGVALCLSGTLLTSTYR